MFYPLFLAQDLCFYLALSSSLGLSQSSASMPQKDSADLGGSFHVVLHSAQWHDKCDFSYLALFNHPALLPPCDLCNVSGIVLTIVVLLWQTSQTVLFRIQGPLQMLLRAISFLAIAGFIWGVRALQNIRSLWSNPHYGPSPWQAAQTTRLRPPGALSLGPPSSLFSMLVLIWSIPNVTSDACSLTCFGPSGSFLVRTLRRKTLSPSWLKGIVITKKLSRCCSRGEDLLAEGCETHKHALDCPFGLTRRSCGPAKASR